MSPLVAILIAFLGIVLIVAGATIAKQGVEGRKRSSSVDVDTGQGGFGKDLSDE